MCVRFTCRTTRPVDISFSFTLFSVPNCISWECFDPYCSSQRVFTSSTVQTLASLPCNNWSLCWSYYAAFWGYLLDVCSKCALEDLSLRINRRLYNSLYFLWSVCADNDCNKRGQTSRPVVGTEIQTSCNFKANARDRYYHLGCVHCHFSNAILESPYNLMVW